MRKRILLLPILLAALLIGASSAQAAPLTLVLQDLTPGAPDPATVIVIDDISNDDVAGADSVGLFFGTVGNFMVMVTGSVVQPSPLGNPVQLDLFNFLVESTGSGTHFSATLSRSGLPSPIIGPVLGLSEYYAEFTGATGAVGFQSWIDGTEVLNASTTGNIGPVTYVNPVAVNLTSADYSLASKLDFTFDSSGTISANTKLDVVPTSLPEPTTLLLFGPGMLGLAAFGRRFRSKSL